MSKKNKLFSENADDALVNTNEIEGETDLSNATPTPETNPKPELPEDPPELELKDDAPLKPEIKSEPKHIPPQVHSSGVRKVSPTPPVKKTYHDPDED